MVQRLFTRLSSRAPRFESWEVELRHDVVLDKDVRVKKHDLGVPCQFDRPLLVLLWCFVVRAVVLLYCWSFPLVSALLYRIGLAWIIGQPDLQPTEPLWASNSQPAELVICNRRLRKDKAAN